MSRHQSSRIDTETAHPGRLSQQERNCLLAGKGIGETVILRIEQAGITSLDALADWSTDMLCRKIAAALGSTCWRNSPQARSAIAHAIAIARHETGRETGPDFPPAV